MTEQEKREKVIKALKWCPKNHGCDGCPYYIKGLDDDGYDNECVNELMRDALELLKAQGPRVMTLDEVKSLERDAVVWYEHNGVNKPRPRIVDQVYDSGIIFTDGGHWQFNADAYGKKFRLWTSRPDQATMEAIPWN